MYIYKEFSVGSIDYRMHLSTYKNARPYKIVLHIYQEGDQEQVILWYSHEAITLKFYGQYYGSYDNIYIRECKRKILQFLTKS